MVKQVVRAHLCKLIYGNSTYREKSEKAKNADQLVTVFTLSNLPMMCSEVTVPLYQDTVRAGGILVFLRAGHGLACWSSGYGSADAAGVSQSEDA